jgi:hypothetical protein
LSKTFTKTKGATGHVTTKIFFEEIPVFRHSCRKKTLDCLQLRAEVQCRIKQSKTKNQINHAKLHLFFHIRQIKLTKKVLVHSLTFCCQNFFFKYKILCFTYFYGELFFCHQWAALNRLFFFYCMLHSRGKLEMNEKKKKKKLTILYYVFSKHGARFCAKNVSSTYLVGFSLLFCSKVWAFCEIHLVLRILYKAP